MWKAFFITLFLTLAPITTDAAGLVPCGGSGEVVCQSCHFVQLAQSGIDRLVGVLTIIVILILVVSGIRLVTSAGDASAVATSKKMITNALIGYVIVLVGWLLIDLGMKTLVNESTYGVWNKIQCVDQPIALIPPPLPDRPPRIPGGTGGTPGVAGIPASGTPSQSCTNCSSTPVGWIPEQTIPNGGGPGIDTIVDPLCQSQLAPNGQCQLANDFLPIFTLFHNSVPESGPWRPVEAWPPTGYTPSNPTGIHSHSCFSNGTCVEYHFVAGGIAGVRAINTIIGLAHQYGLLAIYEVKNQAEKDFLVRGGVAAISIQITGTNKPHFTIYTLPPQTVPGGGSTPNSGLPGYCGEYYNGVDRAVPTDPAFTAYGLERVNVTLQDILDGGRINGTLPLPAGFVQDTGQYLSIPFNLSSGDAGGYQFVLADAQGNNVQTTRNVITFSPCPGDFRDRSGAPPANDQYIGGACGSGPEGMFSGTVGFITEGAAQFGCKFPLGKTFYMNIASYDMSSGYPEPQCVNLSSNKRYCGANFTTFPFPPSTFSP